MPNYIRKNIVWDSDADTYMNEFLAETEEQGIPFSEAIRRLVKDRGKGQKDAEYEERIARLEKMIGEYNVQSVQFVQMPIQTKTADDLDKEKINKAAKDTINDFW